MKLWAAVQGSVLYVGTQGAANARDHFIFVARNPGVLRAAPWAKAGQVAAWDAFLANESANNYNGWFGADAVALNGVPVQNASGGAAGVLEGTIDVSQLPGGGQPASVYISAVEYDTNDGGALISATQVPLSINMDGNIDFGEYFGQAVPVSLSEWKVE